MFNSASLLAQFLTYRPAIMALVAGVAGAVLVWRRAAWAPAVHGIAVAVGWGALFPAPWRSVVWPGGTPEHLLLPVLVLVGAELVRLRVRSRWVPVGAVGVAAWWLARSPAGRPEFWRVVFGAAAVAWVLTRVKAAEPRRGLATTLAVCGGLLLAEAPWIWIMTAAVSVTASAGVWAAGRETALSTGLLMVGVVAAEIGAGRAIHGRIGLLDFACAGAVVAPLAVPAVERVLRPWLGRVASVMAPVVVAAAVIGLSWMFARAVHGSAGV